MSLNIPSKRKINTRFVRIYLQTPPVLHMSFIMFLRPFSIYFLHNEASQDKKKFTKINLPCNKISMNKRYTFLFAFTITAFASQIFAQNTAIKRASLSASVIDAHSIQKGHYKVQQSVGHMGIMTLAHHGKHTATRGFLLPQGAASSKETIPDFDWTVYPNPFDSYVNIDFDAPVSGDMVVRLHDILGQLILEKELTAKQQQRVFLGHLAQAEYLLSVELMGKTFSLPLLNHNKTTQDN